MLEYDEGRCSTGSFSERSLYWDTRVPSLRMSPSEGTKDPVLLWDRPEGGQEATAQKMLQKAFTSFSLSMSAITLKPLDVLHYVFPSVRPANDRERFHKGKVTCAVLQ